MDNHSPSLKSDPTPSLQEIFLAARNLEDGEQRQRYLADVTGDNLPLRQRIERMLASRQNVQPGPLARAVEQLALTAVESTDDGKIDVTEHPMIGPYKLLEQIGQGGMGSVYMVQQTAPVKRLVALKVIKAGMDSKEVIARFEAERQALAMMDHPHIAKVLDGGTTDQGRPYFVMELVRGVPITKFCDQQELDLRARVELFIDVCNAVQHAHQKGVIHRDLKPSNLLVTMHDHKAIVKVIDFGVAKALNQELTERTLFTQFSQMIGTPLYMAPEQAQMSGLDIDTRSDIYSLGVVLYELLTGTTPFDRETMSRLSLDGIRKLLNEQEPPRPSVRISTLRAACHSTIGDKRRIDLPEISKQLRGELDWIVMKALEKDRERRYETASAFAADVGRYLNNENVHACPPSMAYRFQKYAQRHRAQLVTLTAVTSLLVGATIVSLTLAAWSLSEQAIAKAHFVDVQRERVYAVEAKTLAEQQEAMAKQQRDAARLSQYYAEIVSGQTDWARGYLQRLSRKLSAHLPVAGGRDFRGWEWYYLFSLCHPELRTLHFVGSTSSAAWSPDGEYIGASGSIWRAESGENIRRLQTSRVKLYRSAWSPDSQRFAWGTAADDSCLYIWDRRSDELRELRGHTSSVWCVDWSPDGLHLASGGIDQDVVVWDAEIGQKKLVFHGGNLVTDVAWSPDGELLAATNKRNELKVWKVATGELVFHETSLRESAEEYTLARLSWHPDGSVLAISTLPSWSLLRRSDWKVIRQQDMPQERGHDIAWRPDGQRLAVADGETIFIWQPDGEGPEQTLLGHLGPISSVAWSPDGQQLVSFGNPGEVKLWDLNSPLQPPPMFSDSPIESLAWAPDNTSLMTTSATDGSVSMWETRSGRRLKKEPLPLKGQAWWSPDRRLVAYHAEADESPEIHIVNGKTGKPRATLKGDADDHLFELAWSEDSTKLALRKHSSQGISVDVWDVDAEKQLTSWEYTRHDLPDGFECKMAWSDDGVHLAVSLLGEAGDDGTPSWHGHFYVLDVASGTTVLKHNLGGWNHRSDIASLAWKPDGEALVAGSRDGLIEAVAVRSGRLLFSTRLHSTTVSSLAWSPEGERIACAAEDGSVKVLSATAGDDLLTFTLEGEASHVAWSLDGRRLAAAGGGGELRVWDASRGYEFDEQGDRQGELAQAYYQNSRHPDSEMSHARLREALKLAPDTLDFWELRGNASAELGDFDRATAEFAKAIQPGLRRSIYAAKCYGDALLAAGNEEAYRRHCVALLTAFIDTGVPIKGGHVAWACTLVQDERIDSEIVLRLARANDGYDDRSKLGLGAALYRSGHYADAASVLSDLATKLQSSAGPAARGDVGCSLYFLAMARQQLGHSFQARRYRDDAVEISARLPPDLSWTVKVELDVLDREARALIGE